MASTSRSCDGAMRGRASKVLHQFLGQMPRFGYMELFRDRLHDLHRRMAAVTYEKKAARRDRFPSPASCSSGTGPEKGYLIDQMWSHTP